MASSTEVEGRKYADWLVVDCRLVSYVDQVKANVSGI